MKTKLKQSLVLVLTFVLLMANVPTSVLAEDNQGNVQEEPIVQQGEGITDQGNGLTNGNTEQVVPTVSGTNENNDSEQVLNQTDSSGNSQEDEDTNGVSQIETQQTTSVPSAAYRLHSQGSDLWTGDEGWTAFDAHQKLLDEAKNSVAEGQEPKSLTPLDSLEVRLDGEIEQSIEYRVRDQKGAWQQDWTKAPNAATSKEGITGLEMRISEEAGARYDLWYRARTADGAWLGWTLANKALETKDLALVCDVQILVTAKGDKPTVGTIAQEEDANPSDNANNKEGEDVADGALKTQDDSSALSDSNSAKAEADKKAEATGSTVEAEAAKPEIEYRAHVQNVGWQDWVKNGALAGTSGRSLRVEGFYFHLNNASGDVLCQSHVQNVGWQDWVGSNQLAGTEARSLRVEAIKLKLTGNIATTHDIYYRAHVQNVGWQDWVKNGEAAGTSGRSLRVEAIEVLLVRKGDAVPFAGTSGSATVNYANSTTPGVRYQAHVQNIGWQNEVSNGAVAGTSGLSYRVEALRIATTGIDGGIRYRMHVQNIGWQDWVSNGEMAGTSGKSYRVEAMQIELTGKAKEQYSVLYRAHVQNVGWMSWAKDGALCGSSGRSWRMEAVQIMLVPRNSPTVLDDSNAFPMAYLSDLTVSYNTHALGGSWLGNQSNGGTGGTTGQSGRIDFISAKIQGLSGSGIRYSVQSEAGNWQSWTYDGGNAGQSGKKITGIRFELTNSAATYYDVWYRAHCANQGWLGWTKNGGNAGADSVAYPIEAYQVMIVSKGASAPGSTSRPYHFANQLNGVDVSGHNWGNGSSARTLRLSEVEGDFFIIKATEGTQGTIYNTRYKQMAEQALSTGRLIGFYHYANGEDAIAEADTFYDAIKDYKGRAIACLDWEGIGNKLFDTGKDVAWCKKFLDRLKLRFGGTPVLYTSKSYTNAYDWSSVAQSYPLWGAEYPDYEDINGYQSNPWQSSRKWGAWGSYPTIFQYTGTGVLTHNGGCSHFDFDLFYGSATDWRKLQG